MIHPLVGQLFIATMAVCVTVLIHLSGLLALLWVLGRATQGLPKDKSRIHNGGIILAAVLGLFALHAVEIWFYALLYMLLGAIKGFEKALYFSTTTYTTIGYGDVLMVEHWRILGAIEGANGIILLGWSTAFLVSVVQRLRALEHSW